VSKASLKPGRQRWEAALAYIAATPQLRDIVVSGGDSYYLTPDQIRLIGARLTAIPHIRRFRFASKGLAVAPGRVVPVQQQDDGDGGEGGDGWVEALIWVSREARKVGKAVAWHTHFNHPAEISWVTEVAARRLFEEGVTVRNQTVMLRGVNDGVETMGALIRVLADNNIFPVGGSVIRVLLWSLWLTTGSTTSTSVTWSRASSTCARRCRPSWTSRPRSAGRLPAS
jgi:lysine 2,3-aminomutase